MLESYHGGKCWSVVNIDIFLDVRFSLSVFLFSICFCFIIFNFLYYFCLLALLFSVGSVFHLFRIPPFLFYFLDYIVQSPLCDWLCIVPVTVTLRSTDCIPCTEW